MCALVPGVQTCALPILLDHDEAADAFATMLDGGASDEQVSEFLVALSDRGETMVEIAAAAEAMRARLIPINAPAGAIDVCGTGGDGQIGRAPCRERVCPYV